MGIASNLDRLHLWARSNRWLRYFTIFNRIALAAGFLPSGFQKIVGERFTALSINHPMGHYLEALFYTGFYYNFIGVMQVSAAILLLIPRTATLGAILYFPIILNICILTFAVRFDGSLLTSPLMVLANLYLLCWDYHKFRFVFPFNRLAADKDLPLKKDLTNRFPLKFFLGVGTVMLVVFLFALKGYDIRPHNVMSHCRTQCEDIENPEACLQFCDCIHGEGKRLDSCLDAYHDDAEETSITR